MTEFVDIENATFLKRSFAWSVILDRRIAVLDPQSIFKMSSVTVLSDACPYAEQMVSVANSALGEWFLHLSIYDDCEKKYDHLRSIYVRALNGRFPKVEIEDRVFSYPKVLSIYLPPVKMSL